MKLDYSSRRTAEQESSDDGRAVEVGLGYSGDISMRKGASGQGNCLHEKRCLRASVRSTPIDLRAQAKLASALRADTPCHAFPRLAVATGAPEIGFLR
jgi:hypothetical protein